MNETTLVNRHPGTSQEQRNLSALQPSYAKVDDRRIEDWLNFTWKHAGELNFFNDDNKLDDNWQPFLNSEPVFLLARLATDYKKKELQAFEAHWKALDQAGPPVPTNLPGNPNMLDYAEQVKVATLAARRQRLLQTRDVSVGLSGIDPKDKEPVQEKLEVFFERQNKRLSVVAIPDQASIERATEQDLARLESLFRQLRHFLPSVWERIRKESLEEMHKVLAQEGGKKAQVGLYLSFLTLFMDHQDKLNQLTERHQHYYFNQVLQLQNRPAIPDKTVIVIETNPNAKPIHLEAGTPFIAGQDSESNNYCYQLKQSLIPNQGKIAALKGLQIREQNDVRQLLKESLPIEAPALNVPLLDEAGRVKLFGPNSGTIATMGLALSSPLFRLSEGKRTISIVLETAEEELDIPQDVFMVSVTGATGWFQPQTPSVCKSFNNFEIAVLLDELEEAIVDASAEVYGGSIPAGSPAIRIELNPKYRRLKRSLADIIVSQCKVSIKVEKLRSLTMKNGIGILSPSSPMQPFGPQPLKGASFTIEHPEMFQKKLDSLTLHWTWQEPPKNFSDYYAGYGESTPLTLTGTIPKNKLEWETLTADGETAVPLASDPAEQQVTFATPTSSFRLLPPDSNQPSQGDRILQVTLGGPSSGFGQLKYPQLAAETEKEKAALQAQIEGLKATNASLENLQKAQTDTTQSGDTTQSADTAQTTQTDESTEGTTQSADTAQSSESPDEQIKANQAKIDDLTAQLDTLNQTVVNPPYDPIFTEFYVDYETSQTVDFSSGPNAAEAPFAWVELAPFGYVASKPQVSPPLKLSWLKRERGERELFVGIEGMTAGQPLSMYIKVVEGSGAPNAPEPDGTWYYLTNNEWRALQKEEIKDGTKGLLQSGIVNLTLPFGATDDNTLLAKGLHWLRYEVTQESHTLPKLQSIHTQAALVIFQNQNQTPDHPGAPLPAGTITSMEKQPVEIVSITQPYDSFGRRVAETDDHFYKRASERLQHKGRAVNRWDYEHLILEEFPEVSKVKCLNHTNGRLEESPGDVTLIVMPHWENRDAWEVPPSTPLALRSKIEVFLQKRVSPFVTLFVLNPLYEKVQVQASIRFQKGFDPVFYKNSLNAELRKFITPWCVESVEIPFGGSLSVERVELFIRQFEYVNNVKDFKLLYIVGENRRVTNEIVKATTPASVLISHTQHDITIANQ